MIYMLEERDSARSIVKVEKEEFRAGVILENLDLGLSNNRSRHTAILLLELFITFFLLYWLYLCYFDSSHYWYLFTYLQIIQY